MHGSPARKLLAPGYCLFALLAVLVLLFTGCSSKNDALGDKSIPRIAKSTVERGPVRATIEAIPASAALSGELTLTLSLESIKGVKVEMPPFGETLGDFIIRESREPLPKIRDSREIIEKILTLEPTCPGRFTIDPINISFTDLSSDGDGKPHIIETEPISVVITTEIDGQPSLGDMRGAAEPLGMNAPIPFWVWPAALAIAAAAVVGWRLTRRRRRRRAAAAIVLTPEEIANRELDELAASGLAERDVKQFYVELTGIVRHYIERTTAIRAPEQTTEEFLREISLMKAFDRDDGLRLRNFLEAADLVKFAAHRPRGEDINESVRRARLFIGMRWLRQIGAFKPETKEVAE
ncbi:MAG: hypothetical protein JW959_06690 [Pirellulales bacterium]|nr:hypothetical protein [Pirellulales bacterium]